MKRNKYYRTYRRDQYRPYRPRFEIFSLDNENRGGEAWRWICSYVISEKLYCSGLITGVDNLKKVKKVCISKIYGTKLQFRIRGRGGIIVKLIVKKKN